MPQGGEGKEPWETPIAEDPPRSSHHQGEFGRLAGAAEEIRNNGDQGTIILEEEPDGSIKFVGIFKCFFEGGGPVDCYFRKPREGSPQQKPETTLSNSICLTLTRVSSRRPCVR